MAELGSSRWWENYVVRYFVGTVVGAGIVFSLNKQGASALAGVLPVGEIDPFKEIAVLASVGFAFCYVASAPILTLHALREHVRVARMKESWWPWLIAVVVGLGAAIWLVRSGAAGSCPASYGVAGLLVLVVGAQLALVASSALDRFVAVRNFYRDLSTARSRECKEVGQYVESYRHLREHGNAFSILLLEVVLGFVLANVASTSIAVVVLVLWVLPSSFSWLIGTALESSFAHDKSWPPKA